MQQDKSQKQLQDKVVRSQSDILEAENLLPELNPLRPNEQQKQQMLVRWTERQRESQNILTGQRETLYTYDPNNVDFSVYQKPVSEQKCDIFQKYCPQICQYLTAKFLVQEIIQPIITHKAFSQDVIQNVEFMYLLAFRAWIQMNGVIRTFNDRAVKGPSNHDSITSSINLGTMKKKARKYSETRVEFVFNNEDINMRYLVDPMIKLYLKTDAIFSRYHQLLTNRESYFKQKVKAVVNFVFYHAYKMTKDKFLCGFEGMDFTRDEQIDFMHDGYIVPAIKQLKARGEGSVFNGLISRLGILKDLLKVKIEKMEGFDDFDRVKLDLLSEWKQPL